jgi:hypothetical protein
MSRYFATHDLQKQRSKLKGDDQALWSTPTQAIVTIFVLPFYLTYKFITKVVPTLVRWSFRKIVTVGKWMS